MTTCKHNWMGAGECPECVPEQRRRLAWARIEDMVARGAPPPTEGDQPWWCPHCGAGLLADPIPVQHQHLYAGHWFKREVGRYSQERDRLVSLRCPDCEGELRG